MKTVNEKFAGIPVRQEEGKDKPAKDKPAKDDHVKEIKETLAEEDAAVARSLKRPGRALRLMFKEEQK